MTDRGKESEAKGRKGKEKKEKKTKRKNSVNYTFSQSRTSRYVVPFKHLPTRGSEAYFLKSFDFKVFFQCFSADK